MRDPKITSRIMSSIRSRGGKADFALGSRLWRRGFRYRRRTKLLGRPDLVFVTPRVAVFVDGDFWHGRGLDERIARGDFKRNAEYWITKLRRNAERDQEVTESLERQGWKIIRLWESDVLKDVDAAADAVAAVLNSRRSSG